MLSYKQSLNLALTRMPSLLKIAFGQPRIPNQLARMANKNNCQVAIQW